MKPPVGMSSNDLGQHDRPSRSHGHHVTTASSCATPSAGHLAVALGPEGPNPLFLRSISVLWCANAFLAASLCLHAYLFSIPTRRPFICIPVPGSHPRLLHLHVDSHHSYRCPPDFVPIAYLCLRPCGSISYK